MPTLNMISSTARLTTFCCAPASNERTAMSGVRFDGATVSRKTIANSSEQPADEGVVRDVAHPVDEIGEVAGLARRRCAARR